jgi:ribokinase
MYDVITFGSAAWDVFLKLDEFKTIKSNKFSRGRGLCLDLGSKIDVKDIFLFSGGGGINTAATFARQGFKTAFCGAIGNDIFGKEIIEELKKLKIATRFIFKTDLRPTNFSIIFNTGPKKDKTVMAYRGAAGFLNKRSIPWSKLRANWFYLAPLTGELADITEEIVNFCYRNKIKVAFNPGKYQLSRNNLRRIIKKVDVLFLNKEEASLLTKVSYNKEREIFKKLDYLCPGIAIMGSKMGILASDGKYIYKAKNSMSKVADRAGAGDAFASGFVSGLIKKGDIEYGIQLGMANSSSCVQKWGANQGLIDKRTIPAKVKIIKKKL